MTSSKKVSDLQQQMMVLAAQTQATVTAEEQAAPGEVPCR